MRIDSAIRTSIGGPGTGKAEHCTGQRDAVGDSKRRDGLQQLPESAQEQEQSEDEQQMINAKQDDRLPVTDSGRRGSRVTLRRL